MPLLLNTKHTKQNQGIITLLTFLHSIFSLISLHLYISALYRDFIMTLRR